MVGTYGQLMEFCSVDPLRRSDYPKLGLSHKNHECTKWSIDGMTDHSSNRGSTPSENRVF